MNARPLRISRRALLGQGEVGVEEHGTDVAFPAWANLKHVTYPACQSIPVAELTEGGPGIAGQP